MPSTIDGLKKISGILETHWHAMRAELEAAGVDVLGLAGGLVFFPPPEWRRSAGGDGEFPSCHVFCFVDGNLTREDSSGDIRGDLVRDTAQTMIRAADGDGSLIGHDGAMKTATTSEERH